jgi:iodotyrosine deiodinase
MKQADFMRLEFTPRPEAEIIQRAKDFYELLKRRRSVRDFSDKTVPKEIIDQALLTAGTAPNGANQQPWHFVVVGSPEIKKQIRDAAEEEEREFYQRRAPEEWLDALAPLGTDEHKPFLETAPYLIAIFAQAHGVKEDGSKVKHYYVNESVGIATGFLVAALHNAGLACLTHTPSPMNFLSQILNRPSNERPFVLLVVGYPAENATVPVISKKSLEHIATFLE